MKLLHRHALRVHPAHDVPDRPVLAAGVERLQADEHAVGVLGGQTGLVLGEHPARRARAARRRPSWSGSRPCTRGRSPRRATPSGRARPGRPRRTRRFASAWLGHQLAPLLAAAHETRPEQGRLQSVRARDRRRHPKRTKRAPRRVTPWSRRGRRGVRGAAPCARRARRRPSRDRAVRSGPPRRRACARGCLSACSRRNRPSPS